MTSPSAPAARHSSTCGPRVAAASCLVSDLRFRWRLEPLPHDTTQISVHVDIPDKEAHRLDAQRDAISRSVRRLADLAGQNGS